MVVMDGIRKVVMQVFDACAIAFWSWSLNRTWYACSLQVLSHGQSRTSWPSDQPVYLIANSWLPADISVLYSDEVDEEELLLRL